MMNAPHQCRVTLLTGGHDASYAHGLTRALVALGLKVDFVAGDSLDADFLHSNAAIRFLNLRGDQSEGASAEVKLMRVLRYYARLVLLSLSSGPGVFHILWNNKFEHLDRTLLTALYRLGSRGVVMTAHNVNAAKRDGHDSWWNRATLRCQYKLVQHIFVHTRRMAEELQHDFGVPSAKVSVIPFGLNDEAPRSDMTGEQARSRLAIGNDRRVALVFGQIAPYKGLEYLAAAVSTLGQVIPRLTIVIAGKIKRGHETYWQSVATLLAPHVASGTVVCRLEHVPDEELETYFKAADVLVMPYVQIFQSGLPFLAYSFGLPVVSTRAGSLSEDVVEGETGFLCDPQDSDDLARAVSAYFASPLYSSLSASRQRIRDQALKKHSWTAVAPITRAVYRSLAADV